MHWQSWLRHSFQDRVILDITMGNSAVRYSFADPEAFSSYTTVFRRFRTSLLASFDFKFGKLYYWTCDADTIKRIISDPQTFQKDLGPVSHSHKRTVLVWCVQYVTLEVFGPNLVTKEGDDWRRHHKIAAPAFNEVCQEENFVQFQLLSSITDQ